VNPLHPLDSRRRGRRLGLALPAEASRGPAEEESDDIKRARIAALRIPPAAPVHRRCGRRRGYSSPNFKTGTYAFDVPKLPAGAYQFVCTLHPVAMTGMLTID
jgi:hypothetical protein